MGMCGWGRSDKSCASVGQLCWFSEEMAETPGNRSAPGFISYGQENSLGCVSLTEKAHFYHFIGSQTIRITFTHCPFLFKLVVMSCLVMFVQCFILLSSSVANSCALSLALSFSLPSAFLSSCYLSLSFFSPFFFPVLCLLSVLLAPFLCDYLGRKREFIALTGFCYQLFHPSDLSGSCSPWLCAKL